MNRKTAIFLKTCPAIALAWLLPFIALQAQAPDLPQPVEEHAWLEKFVGKWQTDTEALMGPGAPPMHGKGTLESKKLGGFWLVNEVTCDMGGGKIQGLQTIGYDPSKKRYVGTWVDSATSLLWKYEGQVEKEGRKLILEATGPNFMAAGEETKFRDAYEFTSDKEMTMTSSMLGKDGKWTTFMTAKCRKIS